MKSIPSPVAVENRSYEDPGSTLWQSGYHEHCLRDRGDFEKRLAYMHDNPLRDNLAKSQAEYPYSTAHPRYRKEIDWAWIEGVRKGIWPEE